ncbi:hypothetical protein [Amycolatopsis silviterrae]|uniref:Uncharacterized protein n=1 Tax=Amycolatopsis silviterrae TaxID=1656914 RepID=A0ABW5HD37_9PSEU
MPKYPMCRMSKASGFVPSRQGFPACMTAIRVVAVQPFAGGAIALSYPSGNSDDQITETAERNRNEYEKRGHPGKTPERPRREKNIQLYS